MSSKVPNVTLSNGLQMPIIGLGTWLSKPEEVDLAVRTALDCGYRHIDTAAVYANEQDIGNTLKAYFAEGHNGLKREDIFITTKLWCTHNRPAEVEPALRESLAKLQTDYVDLYLSHMPAAFKDPDMKEHDHNVKVEDIWKALEAVYEKGLCKAIGVSNYNIEQLERIQKIAKVPIHNLQVELHLHFAQFELHEYCKKHNISVCAYAPIGSPGRKDCTVVEWKDAPPPLENPQVKALAQKYNKTPAQILLRHLIQRDLIVIPKSTNKKRVIENFQVFDFELSKEEVDQLNKAPQYHRLFMQDFMEGSKEDPFVEDRKAAKQQSQ